LAQLRERYRNRGYEGKRQMLEKDCEQYGYHCKHAIRPLNGTALAKKSPPSSLSDLVQLGKWGCGGGLDGSEYAVQSGGAIPPTAFTRFSTAPGA